MELQNFKYDSSNFETSSVSNRMPMQFKKNRPDLAKTRFLGNHPSDYYY